MRDHLSYVERYLELTRQVMPRKAREAHINWPVRFDHCFQRIVLDTICGDVWYNHLQRPAYRHLSDAQAREAVALCEDILSGRADLWALNAQSLAWRGKVRNAG
ncbi:MAG: hypothetical protein AAGI03_15975 [Pseudomonadota bacterium]